MWFGGKPLGNGTTPAVRLTANLNRRLELEEDGLADENLASLGAEVLDLVLLELDGPAGAVSTDCGVSSVVVRRILTRGGGGGGTHLQGGGQ